MDITAKISLATAIFEFIVVAWAYFKFERTPLSNLIVTIIILLGLYQFSEYMLCSSTNYLLWGKVMFISYTFIPSLILYYAITRVLKKHKPLWVFIPGLVFVGIALLERGFAPKAFCANGLAQVHNKFFYATNNLFLTFSYYEYFFITIALTVAFLYRAARRTRIKNKKIIYNIISAATFLSIIFPTLTVIFFTKISYMYPSIFNRYLTLFVITGIICLFIERKILQKEKDKNPDRYKL